MVISPSQASTTLGTQPATQQGPAAPSGSPRTSGRSTPSKPASKRSRNANGKSGLSQFAVGLFSSTETRPLQDFLRLTREQATEVVLAHMHAGSALDARGASVPLDADLSAWDDVALIMAAICSCYQCSDANLVALASSARTRASTADPNSPESRLATSQDCKQTVLAIQGSLKPLEAQLAALSAQAAESRASMAALQAALAAQEQPAGKSYAAAAKEPGPDLTELVKHAAESGAAAALKQKEAANRKRNIVVWKFPAAVGSRGASETEASLLSSIKGPDFLGKLGLQHVARVERAARLAGPTGPVVLTMADMASKIAVLKARKELRGTRISLDEDYTKPQIDKKKAALARADVTAARARLLAAKSPCRMHVRWRDELQDFIVVINGQAYPPPGQPPTSTSAGNAERDRQ